MSEKELIRSEREERINALLGSEGMDKKYSREELGVFDSVDAVEVYVALVLNESKGGDLTETQKAALERLGKIASKRMVMDVLEKYI